MELARDQFTLVTGMKNALYSDPKAPINGSQQLRS